MILFYLGENAEEHKVIVRRKEEVPNNPLTLEEFKQMYLKAKGDQQEGKSKIGDNYFYIDCRSPWTMRLVSAIANSYALPVEITGVGIGYLDENCTEIKNFLVKSITGGLDWLWINYIALDKWEKQFRLGIDEYMDSILKVVPKVKKWIGFNYFKIDSEQFSSIIRSAHKIEEKIDFDNSALRFETPLDFGTEAYKIPKICMEDTFVKCK